MIFRSKAPGHVFIARPEAADMMMGYKRIVMRELIADFGGGYVDTDGIAVAGSFGEEFKMEDVHGFGGDQFSGAQIRGGVFDSDVAAKALGWTPDEKKLVEDRLVETSQHPQFRGDVWVYEPPKLVAPWPTYDDMHHNTIPERAEEMGLVQEALIYEQRTKKRDSVLAKLREKAERAEQEKALVAQ
jgi:hypothetical protein